MSFYYADLESLLGWVHTCNLCLPLEMVSCYMIVRIGIYVYYNKYISIQRDVRFRLLC